MTIECAKCGCELSGRGSGFRRYAKAQGWKWFVVGSDLYWLCWRHTDAVRKVSSDAQDI